MLKWQVNLPRHLSRHYVAIFLDSFTQDIQTVIMWKSMTYLCAMYATRPWGRSARKPAGLRRITKMEFMESKGLGEAYRASLRAKRRKP